MALGRAIEGIIAPSLFILFLESSQQNPGAGLWFGGFQPLVPVPAASPGTSSRETDPPKITHFDSPVFALSGTH